ncbi:MAG: hypothetical protein VX059_07955 [SAR324 cluster bacterium]|nr:hypothetical protein [SAR324 cluster bacterium]
MLITDLKTPCTLCKGSGFEAGYNEYGSLQSRLQKTCSQCLGKGYLLTELGREIWELLQPMVQDLVREELQERQAFPKQFRSGS